MSEFVYFDIETIPCQDDAVKERLTADAKPPANYKSEEAIAKWRAEKADDIVAKTSFDGGRGHVCCIAWALGNDEVASRSMDALNGEANIIRNFFESLDQYHSTTIVGHYIHGFDVRFLTQRAIVLGIKLPPSNVWPRDPKPWDRGLFDTMTAWCGAKDNISMDNLCDILGVTGKDGFDGSMVAEAWANGEHEQIAMYCRDDVERTRQIHQKFMAAGW